VERQLVEKLDALPQLRGGDDHQGERPDEEQHADDEVTRREYALEQFGLR
jgi:hypothetical protein